LAFSPRLPTFINFRTKGFQSHIVKLIRMTSRYQSHDVMLFIDIGQSRQQHFCLHVVTIYGIDAVANEIDVVLKFVDSGMKIQDFN
jgi:hypothetical protein